MKSAFLKFFMAFLLVLAVPALAAEGEKAEKAEKPAAVQDKASEQTQEKAPAAQETDKASENPYRAQIGTMARELAKSFNKDQALALAQIRNGFGMIRAVHLVEGDVSKAIAACGKTNPDMKGEMDARFEKWSTNINPLLKKSQADMDTTLKAAGFPDGEKVKAYLDLIDKAAQYSDSKIEKNVITTPEACGSLLKSMDDTEPTMTSLLQSIVWVPEKGAGGEPPADAAKE